MILDRWLRDLRAGRVATGTVVLALLLAALAWMPAARAASPGVAAEQARDGDGHDHRAVLTDDMVRPTSADGILARGRLWPGKAIRFHERIPAKWDWSLQRAINHWNQSGARIEFVRVARARRADLHIGYGDTGGADGMATLGYQSHNWVHLAPGYKDVDATDPLMRVWVGRLFAHELGHVLGFGHTGGCTLMTPVFVMGPGGCKVLSEDKPGYYYCRWIDKTLLGRFIDWYGGRAHRPPRLCLIEKLPPRLRGVGFAGGGAGGPVTVTWTPPDSVRTGTRVVVSTWRKPECTTNPPDSALRDRVDPAKGKWVEAEYGQGEQCYLVRIVNRYGAGRTGGLDRREQHAPVPVAPVLGEPTWQADLGAWRFTWAPVEDADLAVMHAPAGACASSYQQDLADWPTSEGGGDWLVHPGEPEECLSFFVVTHWGTVSPVTFHDVVIPEPTTTPQVGTPVSGPAGSGFATVTATLPGDPSALWLQVEVVAGACPQAVPADAGWWDGAQSWEDPTVWELYPEPWEDPGASCAHFAAFDFWGRHGPVVSRTFTAG